MSPAAESAGPRKGALVFIFITVVLDMLALGIIVPVLPKLILRFAGGDSVHAASVYGLFGTVFAAMQFLFAPALGALSDRFGRRPVILLSNLGLGLDYVLMALAPSLAWLFVGRLISGICAATFSIPSAYIADVTPPEKRAGAFGLLGAAFGLGFVVGPAFGGLLGSVDPSLPFWVASGLSLSNFLYGAFILPESLPAERRAAFHWRRANPVGSFFLLQKHPEVLGIAGVVFLSYLAHDALPSIWVLYTDYRFHWDARMVGLTLAAVGVASVIVQAGMIGAIVKRLGERRSLAVGLALGAIGFAVYGLAPTGWMFCLGIPFAALWALAGPSSQALMTRRMDPSEQGRLQGALAGLRGVSGMLGPGVFTATFAAGIRPGAGWHVPGAAFLLAALLLAVDVGVAAVVTRAAHSSPTGNG